VKIPIIGAGGILTGQDAIEYLLAGATAIEIGTGVLTRGIAIFSQICDEIGAYLTKYDIEQVNTLTGQMEKFGVNT
jgi:dihydroorotate dehydrogenase (NAD+) catalytic subunit